MLPTLDKEKDRNQNEVSFLFLLRCTVEVGPIEQRNTLISKDFDSIQFRYPEVNYGIAYQYCAEYSDKENRNDI